MVAANVMRGDHKVVSWEERDWEAVAADPSALILDVREPGELQKASAGLGRGVRLVPGARTPWEMQSAWRH